RKVTPSLMRRPTLGQKLRAIILAMPFAGGACDCNHTAAGCTNAGSPSFDAGYGYSQVFLLPRGHDGGDCFLACGEIPLGSVVTDRCAFTTLDCEPGVACAGVPTKGRRPPGL